MKGRIAWAAFFILFGAIIGYVVYGNYQAEAGNEQLLRVIAQDNYDWGAQMEATATSCLRTSGGDYDSLAQRIGALEQEVKALKRMVGTDYGIGRASLESRIAVLEDKVKELSKR